MRHTAEGGEESRGQEQQTLERRFSAAVTCSTSMSSKIWSSSFDRRPWPLPWPAAGRRAQSCEERAAASWIAMIKRKLMWWLGGR